MKRLSYAIVRWLIGLLASPRLAGLPVADVPANSVYVFRGPSQSDLAVLDMLATRHEMPHPRDTLDTDTANPTGRTRALRHIFLNRPRRGKTTPKTYNAQMLNLLGGVPEDGEAPSTVQLIPVFVAWGRAPTRERSLLRVLLSEDWAVTGRLKRMVNILLNGRDILVHLGQPLPLTDATAVSASPTASNRAVRRAAHMLRVRLKNQQVAILGPDFSHRRTLVNQIAASRAVRDVIHSMKESMTESTSDTKLSRRARKYAMTIASDMSYPTVRVLERLLRWFWNRIYNGVRVSGLAPVIEQSATHTLIYVPSHRSHVDYLLLSHLLYQNGLMIPHIAAGDNLNLPVLGGILRRGGAFFMRRSFRNDRLYAAVFSEYLYQVYRRGHCVEFFPEGGRSRTGRLLPARLGLLKMTLEHHERDLPRPIAFVPVYVGYEKLIEASSYLDELRGVAKQRESLSDVFRNLKLIKQNFGQVDVNFGQPFGLDEWREQHHHVPREELAARLGHDILARINSSAAINPVNLVSLATLAQPKLAIEESRLEDQIACYTALLQDSSFAADADNAHAEPGTHGTTNTRTGPSPGRRFSLTTLSPREIISYVERLGLLKREHEEFGEVLALDPFTAVLLTWYRNNVAHTLALPSLIACLMVRRRRSTSVQTIKRMTHLIFPYLSRELNVELTPEAFDETLNRMVRLGLLQRTDNTISAPAGWSAAHYRLNGLAGVVMQTLERLHIVISLLARGGQSRESLQLESQQIARKMSRLFGLNAPEFSDRRLFNQFVDHLIEDGVVTVDADGELSHQPIVDEVLRAAEWVIDQDLRYAVMREEQPESVTA